MPVRTLTSGMDGGNPEASRAGEGFKGFFVTGTDTGCGKTEISLGLIQALRQRGFGVQAMKPVASGCDSGPQGLTNPDARRLLAQSNVAVPYAWVNPYAFAPPIAPHIAAREAGVEIDLDLIQTHAAALAARADLLIVEGVGGWRVPLGPDLALGDLATGLGLPVILVVGLRLGCLNHALLTAESILARGGSLAAWVANQVDPGLERREENLHTLSSLLPAPCLGLVPWLADPTPAEVAGYLAIETLERVLNP
jgi:dethiobiotin synthetase